MVRMDTSAYIRPGLGSVSAVGSAPLRDLAISGLALEAGFGTLGFSTRKGRSAD